MPILTITESPGTGDLVRTVLHVEIFALAARIYWSCISSKWVSETIRRPLYVRWPAVETLLTPIGFSPLYYHGLAANVGTVPKNR